MSHQDNIKRNNTFDIMKGIGMLLVIIGHCWFPLPIRSFIFTFHMPLFFFVSGYFFREKNPKDLLLNDFKRLLIPYFITCTILIGIGSVQDIVIKQWSETPKWLIATLWGSGSTRSNALGAKLPSIGAVWFLLALFICRNAFNYLYSLGYKYFNTLYITLAILATIFCNFIYLPWSILQGLSAMLFYGIGWNVYRFKLLVNKPSWFILFTALLIWHTGWRHGSISMACAQYKHPLLDVATAVSGSYFVFLISKLINYSKKWKYPLVWFGKNSLIALCCHTIELSFFPWQSIRMWMFISLGIKYSNTLWLIVVLKIALICFCIYHLKKIKLLSSLEFAKQNILRTLNLLKDEKTTES